MKRFGLIEIKAWWGIGLTSLLIFGGILFLLSYRGSGIDKEGGGDPSPEVTKVNVTRLAKEGGEQVVAEEAQFFDPTPLFLPTEWNADQKPLPTSVLNDPGQMFSLFPSKLQFGEEGLALDFRDTVKTPSSAAETMELLAGEASMGGMGRLPVPTTTLVGRGGYLTVKSPYDDKRVIMSQMLAEARPPVDIWRPIQFLAVINRAGLVGSLSLVERSGDERVDQYFENYLVQSVHLGQLLRPGIYRISVGP